MRIEAALSRRTRSDSAPGAGLTAEEFAILAEAFDLKVEGIRAAQDAKSQALTRNWTKTGPISLRMSARCWALLMLQRGAYAIIDKRAVFLAFEAIDSDRRAIGRIDAVLGDGSRAAAGQG